MVAQNRFQLPDVRIVRRVAATLLVRESGDESPTVVLARQLAQDLIDALESCVLNICAGRAVWTYTLPRPLARVATALADYHRASAEQQRKAAREWLKEHPDMPSCTFDKVQDEAARALEPAPKTAFTSAVLVATLDLLAVVVASLLAAARNVRRCTAGGHLARLPSITLTPRLAAAPVFALSA